MRKAIAASKVIADLMLLNGCSGSATCRRACSRAGYLFNTREPGGWASSGGNPVPEFLLSGESESVAHLAHVSTDLVMTLKVDTRPLSKARGTAAIELHTVAIWAFAAIVFRTYYLPLAAGRSGIGAKIFRHKSRRSVVLQADPVCGCSL